MSRETHSVNIRADSDCTGKIQCRGACIHFSEVKVELPRLVARYAKEMGVSYEKVFVKAQKTRWGSCSSKGNVNLNCLLMKVPPYVRKYVIVHELAHRK